MNKRVIALAATAAGVLITGAAVAQAQTEGTEPWAPMNRMHNSEQMREWNDQMPEEARELCDEMHEQMGSNWDEMGQMHREGGGPDLMLGWDD